jgi:hypothetical protein
VLDDSAIAIRDQEADYGASFTLLDQVLHSTYPPTCRRAVSMQPSEILRPS